jgi:cell division inhibitor SulA
MPSSIPTRAIDRLRKAANLEPTKKNVELSDGTIFEMWVSPLTMAERERAQKQAKSDDANAFALQLLISKALDENGSQALRPRRNRRTQERSQGQGSPDPDAGHPHR